MIDRYGREITYLRLSVTDRCNLRCRYCMPPEGVEKKPHADMLTEDEMITAVEAAASLGVTKLRVTGGEPLIKRNIVSICRRAARVEGIREVCITTNGLLLPEMAEDLIEAGVSRVNFSLDTLDPDRYAAITRVGSLDRALAGLRTALTAGFRKVKLNAVLIGGFNDDEIRPLAELTLRDDLDVRFIELMPMPGGEAFGQESYIPVTRVLEALPGLRPEESDGVARLYRLPGAKGRVGLISPVSRHFCAACNRIRLTADGRIKPCLHSAEEVSLKGLGFAEMREAMARAIMDKPQCHGELSADSRSLSARGMSQIGG
ncbi:MAG: GTP 3',8-cyclase MoaA [Clostridia bacterium]|nr:GTP 3',8-cyclase MoaA [Clostridia bacterium]